MLKCFRVSVISLLILTVGPLVVGQDAKKVWKEIVKPCTLNELQGKKVIFLGISNNIEVGTLLRPRKDQGGYGRASYQNVVDEYLANPTSPRPMPNPVTGGNWIACSGQVSTKKDLKANLGLLSAVIPFTGEFGGALATATITSGTAGRVAMYDVDEILMARVLDALPANSKVKAALLQRSPDSKPVWYMVSRAFRVDGLKAKIDFHRNMGADFKGKYTGPLGGAGIGELGGGLSANWLTDSVLELSSTTPFFIA